MNLKLTVRPRISKNCIGASGTSRVASLELIQDEKGDLVSDSHSILNRWRNHFSQPWNIHGVNYVRRTEIHTAEPIVPEPSAFEVEMAVEKMKRHK